MSHSREQYFGMRRLESCPLVEFLLSNGSALNAVEQHAVVAVRSFQTFIFTLITTEISGIYTP